MYGGEGGIDSGSLGAAFTPSGQYRKRYRLKRSLGRALSNPGFLSVLLFIHPKKSLHKGGLFLDGGEGGIDLSSVASAAQTLSGRYTLRLRVQTLP